MTALEISYRDNQSAMIQRLKRAARPKCIEFKINGGLLETVLRTQTNLRGYEHEQQFYHHQ
jgi:hypothetical protein